MKKIFYISGTTIPGGGPEHIYQLLKTNGKSYYAPQAMAPIGKSSTR